MTINLSADLEAAVADEAQRLGTTPDRIVELALRERLRPQVVQPSPRAPNPDERLQRILAATKECGISLSNEALSSEGLYD